MNKIFNINLGGYPFTIDEDAYEHLNAYLKTIHGHFRQSEGYEEITEDIEARLAEIFQEKLGNRPIVNMKDVKDAVATMGTPEEFGAETTGAEFADEASSAQGQYKTGKRLFRNPEEEVIGGVCSGLAAYFGIQDPIWVRILFIILVVSGGFGVPIYIILWAVVPKAESASDRLAMRGEPINVSNIGKIIEEGFKDFSDKVSELGDEISSKKKSFSTEKGSEIRGALAKGIHFLGLVIRRLLDAFANIWKPIVILVGLALILAFAISWIVSIIGLFYSFPFLEYLNPGNDLFSIIAPINLLFIIGIPLIGLGLFVARLAFGTRVQAGWRSGMLAFWIINFVSLAFWGSMVARDFSAGTEIDDRFYLQQPTGDTLSLTQAEDQYEYAWYSFGDHLKFTGEELIGREVFLTLQKSETDQFELIKHISARGRTIGDAGDLAREVRHQLVQEGDQLLIDPVIVFPKGTKWRAQRIELRLSIPEGKYIRLDKNLMRRVRQMDLADGQRRAYADNMLWLMEEDGLTCLNCPPREDERSFDLDDFSGVKVDGPIRVDIERNDIYGLDYQVSLQGEERDLDDIDVMVAGQTLTVITDREGFSSPVTLRIKAPTLKKIAFNNTKDVEIKGLQEPHLELLVQGENDLTIFVDLDSLTLRQQGRNRLDLRGRAAWLNARLNDHARLNAEKAMIEKANLELTRYSNAELPPVEKLDREVEENSMLIVGGEREARRME